MQIRDAIVLFENMRSRVGGKLLFLDEVSTGRIKGFLSEFGDVTADSVAEGEFAEIKENTTLIIVAPPESHTHYEPLEAGSHKINIIGVGECCRDEVKLKDGTDFIKLIKAIGKVPGYEVFEPQGAANKFIGGPATVLQVALGNKPQHDETEI